MNVDLEAFTPELNSAILATFVPIRVQLHGSSNLAEMTLQVSTWMKEVVLFARLAHMVMSVLHQPEV
jgi:hypothetical protein